MHQREAATAPEPSCVLGNDACIKCHAAEQAVWASTPHARTFDQLHRRVEARQIAARLGIASIKHSGRCTGCHYTEQADPADAGQRAGVIAGVSCESCHGAARDWLDVHHDYGGPGITRQSETSEHRRWRIAESVRLGMRNPRNVYAIAQSCYRCHTAPDEELVNVGGHSVGSQTFEFVSWSQGTIHHNFTPGDGQAIRPSSPQRLRVMFVAGVIAETEASLRAVAGATVKARYGVTVAKRAARAGTRLKSLADKLPDKRLRQAAEVFDSVELKLNHAEQLTASADELARIGLDFADSPPSSGLEVLDEYIPPRSSWK